MYVGTVYPNNMNAHGVENGGSSSSENYYAQMGYSTRTEGRDTIAVTNEVTNQALKDLVSVFLGKPQTGRVSIERATRNFASGVSTRDGRRQYTVTSCYMKIEYMGKTYCFDEQDLSQKDACTRIFQQSYAKNCGIAALTAGHLNCLAKELSEKLLCLYKKS